VEKEMFQIPVTVNGEPRLWSVNKTSQRILVSLLGQNSDTWKGKKVKVYTISQKVGSDMKNVIYAKGERVQ